MTTIAPRAVGQTASSTSPKTTKAAPTAATPERILGTVLWCFGTGTLSLFSHTRSPRTPLAAQLSIDFGSEKSRGLNQAHRRAAIIGTSDHHPNHSRLHTARISRGKTVLRVQTLHGLACRLQVASSIRNAVAILRSRVISVPRCGITRILLIHEQAAPPSGVGLNESSGGTYDEYPGGLRVARGDAFFSHAAQGCVWPGAGSTIDTHSPPPSRLSRAMRPPWASAISRARARPRPVPLRLVE